MIYETPLTIREKQMLEDEEAEKSKGLKQHLLDEAVKELVAEILNHTDLPEGIYIKATNLLNVIR